MKGMLCCLQSLFSSIKRVDRVASHTAEAVVACARLVSLMGCCWAGVSSWGKGFRRFPRSVPQPPTTRGRADHRKENATLLPYMSALKTYFST